MNIHPLYSGSKGNSYLVEMWGIRFLIECGGTLNDIRAGLRRHGVALPDVEFCLITHEHKDHCAAVEGLLKIGIDCYASGGTIQAMGISHPNLMSLNRENWLSGLGILTFPVEHDAEEPIGFLVTSTREKLLYITDSYFVRWKFAGLTHVMLEANFSDEIIEERNAAGSIPLAHMLRVQHSHMSLSQAKELLAANDLSKLQEVWLIHLSDGNSNAEQFKNEIAAATGVPVYVA